MPARWPTLEREPRPWGRQHSAFIVWTLVCLVVFPLAELFARLFG